MEDQGLNSILMRNLRNGRYGGFRVTLLVQGLSNREKANFICSACDGILREPVLVEDIFKCESCLEPDDVVTDSTQSVVPLTSRFHVVCPCKKEGCTWNGLLAKLIEHKRICQIFSQKYPNCPDTDIACNFKRYGCEVVTQRKYMRTHEEDNQTNHMLLMDKHIRTKDDTIQTILSELREVKKQLREVETEMKYTCGGIIFELPGIKEKMKSNQTYQITEFYAGLYKFQGTIRSKHNNENKIGVFVQTQRGKFDDDVIWPFCGTISISLINKIDEKLSVLYSFRTEGNPAFDRVMFRCHDAHGYPNLATHDIIKKEEYSKGDSIKIKISVQFDAQLTKANSNARYF